MLGRQIAVAIVCIIVAAAWGRPDAPNDPTTNKPPNLLGAATKVDISPPIGMPLAGYGDRTSGSTGIRDPLRAGVLVFDDGAARAAMITLDLISIGLEETEAIRNAVASQAGIAEDHVLVASSHTHGSPRLKAATDYGRIVTAKIAGAAAAAAARLEPVTIGFAGDSIEFCVNRRLLNAEGTAEMKPNPDGVVDPRVRVLRVDGASSHPLAVVMHTACHANVFRNENTLITADFPGVAQHFVEQAYGGKTPSLFLQGAAGDTRPNLPSDDGFRSGTEQDVVAVGTELGAVAVAAATRAGSADAFARRDSSYAIRAAVRTLELPGKDGGTVRADIQALRIGEYLFLTIPGEPFTAFQLQVENALAAHDGLHVFVVGYANGSIGYVVTEDAYPFGGYEPGVSHLAPETESILVAELVRLAEQVL